MVGSSLQVLGRSLQAQGNAAAAEPLFRESLALRKQFMPPDHWLIAASESVLGECVMKQNRFAEAEPLLLRGHERLSALLGEKHDRTQEAVQRLIALYIAWNKPNQASRYRVHLRQY